MEKEIMMPRIGANDDTVVLGLWLVEEGSYVERREAIASLESTKETQDLFAPVAGYIHFCVSEGEEVKVGTLIAKITDKTELLAIKEEKQDPWVDLKITEKAKKIIEQFHIDIALLPKGKLIREKDVEALVGPKYSITETLSNHLIIYGTGGFTREIIHIVHETFAYDVDYIVGGVGDWKDKEQILGIPIIKAAELEVLFAKGYTKVINAVAVTPSAFSRKDVYASLKQRNYDFPNIVARSAVFGDAVKMGEGNLIFAGAVIGTEARIGNCCVINANSTLSHGNIISDCCHIASGATLAGDVVVGPNTLIGQNCTIYSGVHIGKNVLIHNGCSIFKDVPDNSIVKL
jgi:sugar O-acyltransferase (sialic acid O-acetyltransferase NeuD family)